MGNIKASDEPVSSINYFLVKYFQPASSAFNQGKGKGVVPYKFYINKNLKSKEMKITGLKFLGPEEKNEQLLRSK